MRHKILWLSDTHLNNLFPWQRYMFMAKLRKENATAIFHTGDISNGLFLKRDLIMLASLGIPCYFVLGNHSFHWSSFQATYQKVRDLCAQYSNLIWMEDQEVIPLHDEDNEVCLIGAEDWYSADLGDTGWLKYTLDWLLIKEFRQMKNMKERIQAFQSIADQGVKNIKRKLNAALDQGYKTIYILLHYPSFVEATRDEGTMMEKFWLPYNTNIRMGQMIEETMDGRKKRRAIVLTGHTHSPLYVRVSRNVECQVGEGHYLGVPHSQKIYL